MPAAGLSEFNFYPRPPRGGRRCFSSTRVTQKYFYPRPPRGGRRGGILKDTARRLFLSTPSARRATGGPAHPAARDDNFYPRPPRGGRLLSNKCICCRSSPDFYPRPPRGGRLTLLPFHSSGSAFLSTPSARRATVCLTSCILCFLISIHALREEGDHGIPCKWALTENFYPRPPRGGRQSGSIPPHPMAVFLSTPSARRATRNASAWIHQDLISIHALREEGDARRR